MAKVSAMNIQTPVTIREVGLRDGLQSIARTLPTAQKIDWLRAAYDAGQREIEVGSFVPPRLLPQLADTAELVAVARTLPGLVTSVLVPNLIGAQAALDSGADAMLLPLSASHAHSLANLRRTPDEVVTEIGRIRALRDGSGSRCLIEVGLSTAFGCTIQGRVEEAEVLRLLRAVKNRFGAINELGVFGMTDKGLKEVTNPSAIFLTRAQEEVPGSVVMATWEGTRPMLVEVQALVDTSHMANPRRVTLGLDQNRLAMLLAVLHRHGGIPTYDQDVFLNVVGGVKVLETASDLALMAAVISSLRNKPLPHDLLVFGEIGLSGEIRPVPSGQERLKEAAKHGFKRAIVPKGNAPKESPPGLQVIAVTRLEQALDALFE